MRVSLTVNGRTQSVASLQGPGLLNAHINLADRPKENERSNTVRIQGSHTAETVTTSMKMACARTANRRRGVVSHIARRAW